MYVKELKRVLKDIPDDVRIQIQDCVGDYFDTTGVSYLSEKKTLTFLVDDIIL